MFQLITAETKAVLALIEFSHLYTQQVLASFFQKKGSGGFCVLRHLSKDANPRVFEPMMVLPYSIFLFRFHFSFPSLQQSNNYYYLNSIFLKILSSSSVCLASSYITNIGKGTKKHGFWKS